MTRLIAMFLPAVLIMHMAGCSGGSGSEDGGGEPDVPDGRDGTDQATPDGAEEPGADPLGEDPADEESLEDTPEESDMPYGWVRPRCGDSLVTSCSDCLGNPYACNPCELDAVCVADCAADCGEETACADNGTCIETGGDCRAQVFCGCAPPLKRCLQDDSTICLESCTDCPGMPYNNFGDCETGEYPGGCIDGEGPEYLCEAEAWTCASSCEACGPLFCLFASCSGSFCETGYIPDMPFYTCRTYGCCSEGFLCPATSSCVASCAECPGAAAGACGLNGTCVADCAACFEGSTGEVRIQVCSGVCTDLNSDLWNCGACGQPCGGGWDAAACSMGHCCIGAFSDPPPWQWCDDCNCCLMGGFLCATAACEYGCVG